MILGQCRGCDRDLVSKRQYARITVRPRLVVRHEGYELCTACYRRSADRGMLPEPVPRATCRRPERSREDVLDDYRVLSSRGYHRRQCAEHMGMSLGALNRALQRAKAAA